MRSGVLKNIGDLLASSSSPRYAPHFLQVIEQIGKHGAQLPEPSEVFLDFQHLVEFTELLQEGLLERAEEDIASGREEALAFSNDNDAFLAIDAPYLPTPQPEEGRRAYWAL